MHPLMSPDSILSRSGGLPFVPRVEMACSDGVLLRVNRPDGTTLAEVCDNGDIRLHGNPSEAATIFWTAIADAVPLVRERLLEPTPRQ